MNPIAWQTYEFEHREKTNDWFWTVGILGASATVLAVIFSNVLFAALLAIATTSIILVGNKEPALLECEINNKGVRVQKTLYPYMNLESFNVVDGASKKIILKSSKLLMTLITIPLGDVSEDEVVRFLSTKLTHDENLSEPLAHVISEHLGF